MQLDSKKGLRKNPFFNEDGSLNWPAIKIDNAESMVGVFQEDQNHPEFHLVEGLLSKIQAFERFAAELDYDPEALQRLRSRKSRQVGITLENEIYDFFKRVKIIAIPGFPGPNGWTYGWSSNPGVLGDPDFEIRNWGEFVHNAMMDGYAWAIRRCGACRSWYRARRQDQKFCSDKCRERQLRGTSEGKAKRAAYMRRYRAGLRRRDRENLRVREKKG